jgi:predicted MPP superfamily phosphohydrolase
MVLLVVTIVQAPGVVALGWLTGRPLAALLLAAVISTPYLAGLRNPFEDRPKSLLYRALGLWPFFAWWTACLAFLPLGALALLGATLVSAPPSGPLRAAGALSLALGAWATWARPRLVEREVPIAGLPAALDGYRVAQLSDVHCGSFVPEERVAGWVARLNALGADLIAVTGDLISSGDGHTESVARALSGLRAPDGVWACMGNHDYFTEGDSFAERLTRAGLKLLRNRGETLTTRRTGAQLHVAGVDDTWTGRDDVARALAGRPAGVPALCLAHDPNLFPQAAAQGAALTLSGHTHGGQLAVPGLSRRLTLARLITRFTAGLYQDGDAWLYVSRGAGTTGPPIRLGAPAELTLLTLRRA